MDSLNTQGNSLLREIHGFNKCIPTLLNNYNIWMLDFILATKQVTSSGDVEQVFCGVFRGHKYQWEGLHYRIHQGVSCSKSESQQWAERH